MRLSCASHRVTSIPSPMGRHEEEGRGRAPHPPEHGEGGGIGGASGRKRNGECDGYDDRQRTKWRIRRRRGYEEYVAGVLSRRNATFSELVSVGPSTYARTIPSTSPWLGTHGHRVVCVAKKLQKRVVGVRRLMRKGGQTHRDANGDPDAQEYDEQIPSNRVR